MLGTSPLCGQDGTVSDTAGTYAFFAPEACAGGEYSAYKADVWALGVTLFAFVHGRLPFWADGGMQPLFDAIRHQVRGVSVFFFFLFPLAATNHVPPVPPMQDVELPDDSPARSTPGLNDLLALLLCKVCAAWVWCLAVVNRIPSSHALL